jgi:Protein of unknown function (DUF2924)
MSQVVRGRLLNRTLSGGIFKHFARLALAKATGLAARTEHTWRPKEGLHDASKFTRSSQKTTHLGRFGAGCCEPALDTAALRQRWKALFGDDPSPRVGPSLMVKVIAYRLQERALGGLKPATRRLLDRIVEGRSELAPERIPKRRASAGTLLVREWRGISHRGTVVDNEVVYRKRRYKSLSEVARAITGARWSGPLFFGLKRRPKEAANG